MLIRNFLLYYCYINLHYCIYLLLHFIKSRCGFFLFLIFLPFFCLKSFPLSFWRWTANFSISSAICRQRIFKICNYANLEIKEKLKKKNCIYKITGIVCLQCKELANQMRIQLNEHQCHAPWPVCFS